MTKPRILDGCCCEGGASRGYDLAGWDVSGVDLFDKYNWKRYPYPCLRGDVLYAIEKYRAYFDAFHVSPPCQLYSITNHNGREYPDLIKPLRELLESIGKPYIIENVNRAPLLNRAAPGSLTELCGCMFNLTATDDDGITLHLQRPRLFESNTTLVGLGEHDHSNHEWVGGCYGGARRNKYEAKYERKGGYVPPNKLVVQELMGIDWMTWNGLYQAIPPVYTEYVGKQLIEYVR